MSQKRRDEPITAPPPQEGDTKPLENLQSKRNTTDTRKPDIEVHVHAQEPLSENLVELAERQWSMIYAEHSDLDRILESELFGTWFEVLPDAEKRKFQMQRVSNEFVLVEFDTFVSCGRANAVAFI